jgi:nicotinate-nucleotide--dimethylbenzimidazole phosphoribosyltransferase
MCTKMMREDVTMVVQLQDVIDGIKPLSKDWRKRARERLNNLAIPIGSLGRMLDLAEQLAAIKETLQPSVKKKAIVTMAGDHGVVEEGVSTCPQEVTPQMVYNFVAGGRSLRQRLTDMGVVRGTRVKVVKNDMGGPLIISIGEGRLAVGRGMALRIMVEVV